MSLSGADFYTKSHGATKPKRQTRREKRRKFQKSRREIVAQLKSGGCSFCEVKIGALLDFHHIDPSKKLFSMRDVVRRQKGNKTIAAEAAKCVLVCSNHHKIIHAVIEMLEHNRELCLRALRIEA